MYSAFLILFTVSSAFRVLFISDFHFDPDYKINSPTRCLQNYKYKMRCCRSDSIPIKTSSPASKWGDPECDSPFLLLQTSLQIISKTNPDLVLWVGDSIGHHDFNSQSGVVSVISNMTNLVAQTFPNTPVIPVLGNHESWPIDNLDPYSWSWLSGPVSTMWSRWLTRDQLPTFTACGYYYYSFKGLNIIVLQTLWYDKYNKLVKNQTDPCNQYLWLREILSNCKGPIWIVGHCYPGSSEQLPSYTATYKAIVEKYNISAGFWGHSHHDQFSVFNSNIDFISPSILPDPNPGFRIFETDNSWTITEITTYRANFIELLSNKSASLEYSILYKFTKYYNLTSINPETLWALSERLRKDSSLFQDYMTVKYGGAGYYKIGSCNGTNSATEKSCWEREIDSIQLIA